MKGPDGQVTALTGQLHLAGDFKKTRLKLTWLADVPELVPLTLTDFDYLITKKKVGCYFGCYMTGVVTGCWRAGVVG
jgi:hypothetical protein